MMAQFLSDEYFHLVGRSAPNDDERNYGVLKLILAEGCIHRSGANPTDPRASVMVNLEETLASGKLVDPAITCYCDIPFESIAFHAKKYGRFGVSFHRHFLIHRGARPVMYFPMRSDDHFGAHGRTLLRDMDAIYKAIGKQVADQQSQTISRTLGHAPNSIDGLLDALDTLLTFRFFSFLKAYDSELPQDHVDYYYSEREWRLTGPLTFNADDVAHIVVAEGFGDRFKSEMPQHGGKACTVATLVVHSLFRLARNAEDLLRTVRELTERGVTVEFVKDRLTFRGGAEGADAQGTLMLTILAAIAGFERALIRERQREGIAIAKAKGVYSRPRRKKLTPEQVTKLVTLARDGMPKAELARDYGISRETLYQYVRGGG
jgi:hypothetical protein